MYKCGRISEFKTFLHQNVYLSFHKGSDLGRMHVMWANRFLINHQYKVYQHMYWIDFDNEDFNRVEPVYDSCSLFRRGS